MFVATTLREKLSFKIKPNAIVNDNFVFKLHYVVTFWLLLICAALVVSKEYIGEHINCIAELGKDDDDKHKEKFVNTYCFYMSTYTVVRHLNVSALLNRDVAHPGVGPSIDETEEDVVVHAYYQWVHYVLIFQAVCFFLPRLLWKYWKGSEIKAVLVGFDRRKIMDQLEKRHVLDQIQKSFRERLDFYQGWAYALILCEVLNLINIILQIFLTDKKFGPTGTIMYSDILCVMALNIINEKIYVALWYWFFILLAFSILAVLWRLLGYILYSRSGNLNVITSGMISDLEVDKKDLLKLVKHMNFATWLFLQYLSTNMNRDMFRNLLHNMSEKIQCRKSEEEDRFDRKDDGLKSD